MGFGGIGIWQLLIVLVIIVLLFGTKKLRNMGGDLGSALKSFRKAVGDPEGKGEGKLEEKEDARVIDANNVNADEKDKTS